MTGWLWWAIGIGIVALGLAIAYGVVHARGRSLRPRHGAKPRPIAYIGRKIRHPSDNALPNLPVDTTLEPLVSQLGMPRFRICARAFASGVIHAP